MRQLDIDEIGEIQAWVTKMKSQGFDTVINSIFDLNQSRRVAELSKLSPGDILTSCIIAHILLLQPGETNTGADTTDPILEFFKHDKSLGHSTVNAIRNWPRIARLLISKNSSEQLKSLSTPQSKLSFASYLRDLFCSVKDVEKWLNLHTHLLFNDVENSDVVGEISTSPVSELDGYKGYDDLIEELLLSDASGVTESEKLWLRSLPKLVYVSPGSSAEAYHAYPECNWLKKGRSKAAGAGGYLGEIVPIPRVDTLRPIEGLQPRRPCQFCLKDAGRESYREASAPVQKTPVSVDLSPTVEFVEINIGDAIEIIDGPFATLAGSILQIDYADQKITAVIEIFGRETQVELGFSQIRTVPKIEI